MQVKIDKILKIFCSLSFCLFVIFSALQFSGVYINRTESLPVGLYLKEKRHSRIAVGDVILIQKDKVIGIDKKRLKTVHLLLKNVLAKTGDVIELDKSKKQVKINGKIMPGMILKEKDRLNREIKCNMKYPCVIPKGYYFVGSSCLKGYDSRYFGLVSESAILGKARLLYAF